MRRLALILIFWFLISGGCAFAATPAKPYPDVTTGDTLTSTWLMGYFNTLFNWAQETNASVTSLIGGITSQNAFLTASLTVTLATSSTPLIWDASGLGYVPMQGSGAMIFDGLVVAVASNSGGTAGFKVLGTITNNATGTFLSEDEVQIYWNDIPDFEFISDIATPGRYVGAASSPAYVTIRGQFRFLEVLPNF
jgi:hypothetical protein